jgi:hypothetical protein
MTDVKSKSGAHRLVPSNVDGNTTCSNWSQIVTGHISSPTFARDHGRRGPPAPANGDPPHYICLNLPRRCLQVKQGRGDEGATRRVRMVREVPFGYLFGLTPNARPQAEAFTRFQSL